MQFIVKLGFITSFSYHCYGDSKSSTPDGAIFTDNEWVPIHLDKDQSPKPRPPVSESWKDSTTEIFIAIAHYRDDRCGKTLFNLFSKAKHPNRINIGIVEQRIEEDSDCLDAYCKLAGAKHKADVKCPHKSQIKTIFYSKLDARGPTYGRHLQHHLMEDEEFCLQIDSHSDVIPNWDDELLSQWAVTQNEYAVLSTYAPDIAVLDKYVTDGAGDGVEAVEVPHLCRALWSERGMLRNQLATTAIHLSEPILAPLWAAGFSFSKCHVPNDPNLPMIFDGEEFSKFARLWTRGYDVYSPSKPIVGHDYMNKMGQSVNPTEWSRNGM
eukprot:gene12784-26953_t